MSDVRLAGKDSEDDAEVKTGQKYETDVTMPASHRMGSNSTPGGSMSARASREGASESERWQTCSRTACGK